MAYSETTSEGWFGRIGGAIKGVVVGVILFIAAFPMLWMNEGCAVDQYKKIGAVEQAVVEVPAEKVDSANEGKLIHIQGDAKTAEILSDGEFGVSQQAIKLRRDVEMYQVVEHVDTKKKKKVGGGEETTKTYTYSLEWRSSPIDSSSFNRRAFERESYPENPKSFPVEAKSQQATKVTLGAFDLSTGLINSYTKFSSLSVADAKPTKRGVVKHGEGFFMGASPASPKVGDVKITFQAALPGPASVIAQQAGKSFVAWTTPTGKVEWLTEKRASAAEMIADQRAAVAFMTWVLRLVGFLMMFIGLVMVFKPLSVLGDVIPFIGSIIGGASGVVAFLIAASFSSLVIAVAWIAHRPLVAIPLLVVVVGGIVGIFVLKKKKQQG